MRFFIIFAVFLLLLNVTTAKDWKSAAKGIGKAAPLIMTGAEVIKDAIPENAKEKIKDKAKSLKDKILHH
uniref:Uncharacterized protein n=1 Tax=Panagrolaimus sp. ES5 TaxID=591445 RepID=A0AC34G2W0_9BILA